MSTSPPALEALVANLVKSNLSWTLEDRLLSMELSWKDLLLSMELSWKLLEDLLLLIELSWKLEDLLLSIELSLLMASPTEESLEPG